MFEVGREFIIAEGIMNKHKVFLEDEQWVPRQSTVRVRSMNSQLFDILCGIPSLVADLEMHEAAGGLANDRLRSKIVRTLDSLFEWRWRWERVYGGCAFEVMTDSNLGLNLDAHDRPLFPTVLYFSDQLLASDIVNYDACLAFVVRAAEQTLGDSWSSFVKATGPSHLTQPTSVLLLPPDIRSASDAMLELFRMVEFHLSGGKAISGNAFRLLFPLSLAGRDLPLDSDEKAWMRRMCREIADISGFGLFDPGFFSESA